MSSVPSSRTPSGSNAQEARVQQMSQRIAHLEADLAFLNARKAQLERENEALAAAAQRPDLEARLAEALATNARLEGEVQKYKAQSVRSAELEQQQAEIAQAFRNLQGVAAQLVKRLSELDAQRVRLSEEKSAAEAAAGVLRAEFQKLRQYRASSNGHTQGHNHGHCHGHSTGSRHNSTMHRAYSGGRRHPCRLRSSTHGPRPRLGTPPRRSTLKSVNNDAAPMASIELAEMKMERELLRQKLASSEQFCAQACQGRDAMHQESQNEKVKTSELQSELREIISTLSARSDEDTTSPGRASSPPCAKGPSGGSTLSSSYAAGLQPNLQAHPFSELRDGQFSWCSSGQPAGHRRGSEEAACQAAELGDWVRRQS